ASPPSPRCARSSAGSASCTTPTSCSLAWTASRLGHGSIAARSARSRRRSSPRVPAKSAASPDRCRRCATPSPSWPPGRRAEPWRDSAPPANSRAADPGQCLGQTKTLHTKSCNPSIPQLSFRLVLSTIAAMVEIAQFHAQVIDGDPQLLEESYRLRYQVYCVERRFLDATDYPDGREVDEFDEHSVHLGLIAAEGTLIGTARLIKPNPHGFPMFRHCAFFPEVMPPDAPHVVPMEASRLAISRKYMRHHRRTEPLCDLVKAVVVGARMVGANH